MNIWIIGKNSLKHITKKGFYSLLNMEYITDADYRDAKKVCKDFEIENLDEYHDFCAESYTLSLADVF